jgi:hypothetical protein
VSGSIDEPLPSNLEGYMLDEQLVSDISRLRELINEKQRAAWQDVRRFAKSGIDLDSPEARNTAKRLGERMLKLQELRQKAKALALQTIVFPPKGSTE